ncbi:MAG TPA: N-acetylmuramic acid 6-phosphate etherase [Anaerolineae bacterium]|nr:N-acetylmuramic acid 6-phosphate etherase [Anaerolineae bacterium]
MERYVIGVDGGASKTAAVIMNERGEEVGRGVSGSSNYHQVGLECTKYALAIAIYDAETQANVKRSQIAAATFALAGAGRPADARLLESLRAEMLSGMPGQVVTDALAALVGGTGTRCGMVLIAGTGMIAYGENDAGEQARAGGWGHLLDHGSGYDLGQEALRAAAFASDGLNLGTSLDAKILKFLKLGRTSDLINWVYAPDRSPADIASLAPIVLEAAEAHDLAATDIVVRAAEALAGAVTAAARRLGLGERPFPLVLAGGLLQTNHFYRRVTAQAVRTRLPHARPILPQADAAVGAALLALETLGHPLKSSTEVSASASAAWSSEQRNVLTEDLDLLSTLEIVGLMHLEDERAVTAVRPNLPAIAQAVDAIASRMRQGGRLIYVGAGTSGRLGALDASECPPTFGTSPDQVISLMAGGEQAFTRAQEGAEDDRSAGQKDIVKLEVGPLDSIVGIAASGRTPYVAGALTEARQRGALTVALICNLPAPLAQMADHVIAPLVGPEILAGSTRLKAGTAQKLILNMLSTGTMVRLGKTYSDLMVDVSQHNVKLQNRARRIVAQASGISEEEAAEALARSDGDVKTAIVTVLLACTPEEAQKRLSLAGGDVRTAVSDKRV